MTNRLQNGLITHQVFSDPVVQLAALCPLCALSALSPSAALAALSPVLRLFNPASNPTAALLNISRPSIIVVVINARIRLGISEKVMKRKIYSLIR